jgi:hypothetical protein
MPEVKTDVQRALTQDFEGISELLACHVDDIFAAAAGGVTISCEVRVEGDPNPEPAGGTLTYVTGSKILQSDNLIRWQKYQPGEPGSDGPFIGHFVPWGAIGISNVGSPHFWLGVVGGGFHDVVNPSCIDTTLFGADGTGEKFSVKLRVVRI